MALLQTEAGANLAEKVVSKLELVAELPKPNVFHKAQFTRLLLGHTNICITLLSAAQNHEVCRWPTPSHNAFFLRLTSTWNLC